MANPFLSMLGMGAQQQTQQPAQQPVQQNGFENLNEILGLYNLAKGSKNPAETINQMAQTNPTIANAINYIKQNGGDMNKIADQLASQRGLSLNLVKSLFM